MCVLRMDKKSNSCEIQHLFVFPHLNFFNSLCGSYRIQNRDVILTMWILSFLLVFATTRSS